MLSLYSAIENTGNYTDYYIDRAKLHQAEPICDLINAAFLKEKTRLDTVPRTTLSEVSQFINDTQNIACLILLDKERIIGTVQVIHEVNGYYSNNGTYSIHALAIDKEYQGIGLGSRMLNAAEQYIRDQGVTRAFLKIISVAKHPIERSHESQKYDTTEKIEAEKDALADYYLSQGYSFTEPTTIPSVNYIKRTRKTEYQATLFFRLMQKDL